MSAGDEGLVGRFNAFVAQWAVGSLRDDVIYEFTDRTGTHTINASDLTEAATTIADLTARLAERDAEVAKLREHIGEQITHVETRIQDGIEMGASVWRIALEDVVRENRAALERPAP